MNSSFKTFIRKFIYLYELVGSQEDMISISDIFNSGCCCFNFSSLFTLNDFLSFIDKFRQR